jgi:hypothetical protein
MHFMNSPISGFSNNRLPYFCLLVGRDAGLRAMLEAGPGVLGPHTLYTWHPATFPNSALQHSWTVSYNLDGSLGISLSLVHEFGLRAEVLRCQLSPHEYSEGEKVGLSVGERVGGAGI